MDSFQEAYNRPPLPPPQFPFRLHKMLDHAEHDGFQHIVSWLPDGKSFQIHDQECLLPILRRYGFKQNKWKSFLRQLQNYGFRRELKGPLKGMCSHAFFIRGNPDLCHNMKRIKRSSSAENVRHSQSSSIHGLRNSTFQQQRTGPKGSLSAPTLWRGRNYEASPSSSQFSPVNVGAGSTMNASFDIFPSTTHQDESAMDNFWMAPTLQARDMDAPSEPSSLSFPSAESLIWDIERTLASSSSLVSSHASGAIGAFEGDESGDSDSLSICCSQLEDRMNFVEATNGMCSTFLTERPLEEVFRRAIA